MRLERIIGILGEGVRVEGPDGPVDVSDLACDARAVRPGSLFFCLPGRRDDGHRHAPAAVAAGAVAVVCERPVPVAVPRLVVAGARAAMNRLAAPFFGHPGREIPIVGITGTNGKTTVAYLCDAIFRAAGRVSGLVGTVEVRIAGASEPGVRTTPESVDLQRLLRRMVDAGATACAIEATSIGIAQGRIEGTPLQVAVFTNLSRDHLDYHGNMDAYFAAKASLFTPDRTRRALVNADDPAGARLAAAADVETLTYGLEAPAALRAVDISTGPLGSRFRVVGMGLDLSVRVRVPGAFNVSNALAAAGAAHLIGVEPSAIAGGLAALAGIPGRFEPVDEGQDFTVVVDYAHTPDGIANVLRAARDLARGRVIAVFGCGGDRDRGKRPLMGEAAAKHADLVIVTSDNPRSEPPTRILAEIERGLRPAPPPLGYRVIEDRRAAIGAAVAAAGAGDVVVIAGKGHEAGQEIAGRTFPFDDRVVAAEALRGLREGGDG